MINIGLIGCGNIGIALTKALNDQPENSAVISTVYDNDQSSINNLLNGFPMYECGIETLFKLLGEL